MDPSLAAELAALREWRDSCATLSERWPESGDPVAGEWPGVVFGAAEKDDDAAEADHRASAAEVDHRASAAEADHRASAAEADRRASAAAPKRARLSRLLSATFSRRPPRRLSASRVRFAESPSRRETALHLVDSRRTPPGFAICATRR